MTTRHVFKSSLGNSQYTFKNGKAGNFLNGEYTTELQSEIDELNAEIEAGHPYFYVDEAKKTVESTDPMEEVRRRAREEALIQLRQEQAAALDKSRTSESDQDFKIRVANSDDISSAMSGSTSTDIPTAGTASVTGVAAPTQGTAVSATPAQSALAARVAAMKSDASKS